MLPIFPAHLFNPGAVAADIVLDAITGGTSLVGVQDVIQADGGGRWQIAYDSIILDEKPLERLWKAWTAEIAGGSQPFLVPLLSVDTGPRPIAGRAFAAPSDICADDDTFPTEVRFSAPYIIASISAPVAMRATTMQITVQQGTAVQPGMMFSVGVWAYKIRRIRSRNGLSAVVDTIVPARAPIAAGTPANFDWPCVVCRAVPGQDLVASVEAGQVATTSIQFVEDTTYVG